jgi:K+-transporting ATPase ATPase C chain
MRDIVLGALRLSLVTWVLCGLAYPLAVTALGQWLFPWQANGSLKTNARGEIIGSLLIGQQWDGPEWFRVRPSAGNSDLLRQLCLNRSCPVKAGDGPMPNL